MCRRIGRATGPEPVEGTELALEMLGRVLERGHLRAGWVAGDDAFGMSPSFRERLAAQGMWYVLDVPGGTTVWPLEPAWTSAEYQGFGRPRKPRLQADYEGWPVVRKFGPDNGPVVVPVDVSSECAGHGSVLGQVKLAKRRSASRSSGVCLKLAKSGFGIARLWWSRWAP